MDIKEFKEKIGEWVKKEGWSENRIPTDEGTLLFGLMCYSVGRYHGISEVFIDDSRSSIR